MRKLFHMTAIASSTLLFGCQTEPRLIVVAESITLPTELEQEHFRSCSALDPCVLVESFCTCSQSSWQTAIAKSAVADVAPIDVGACLTAVSTEDACTIPTGAACIEGRCRLVAVVAGESRDEQ
jgi:hypothetical protein